MNQKTSKWETIHDNSDLRTELFPLFRKANFYYKFIMFVCFDIIRNVTFGIILRMLIWCLENMLWPCEICKSIFTANCLTERYFLLLLLLPCKELGPVRNVCSSADGASWVIKKQWVVQASKFCLSTIKTNKVVTPTGTLVVQPQGRAVGVRCVKIKTKMEFLEDDG